MGELEKISAWNLTKVRSKKQVIDEARTKGAKVHFASLMDICHLKNAELEAKHQKYKGRVVLRGDIVKDNSGSYAVFTEQGSLIVQVCSLDHKISGRPILARYKHFRTIWEHTGDNSTTDFISSSLKWWSLMHGVDTL